MKGFKGKAIYQPAGKAAEYAKWACNFYVGCSNGCEYCYLKKGRGAKILGGDKPTLKKCFKDEVHAIEVFEKELKANLPELQKHGIFFSFSTDPMLTIDVTICAMVLCAKNKVPVKILTKCADFMTYQFFNVISGTDMHVVKYGISGNDARKYFAFGFTLTGHDELEPGASTNQERIEAMKKLHDAGFKTFASIEPIIDFESSENMIDKTIGFCDLYKIGLMSGKKVNEYFIQELDSFVFRTDLVAYSAGSKIYWKDSITKHINCDGKASVSSDYNIFIRK